MASAPNSQTNEAVIQTNVQADALVQDAFQAAFSELINNYFEEEEVPITIDMEDSDVYPTFTPLTPLEEEVLLKEWSDCLKRATTIWEIDFISQR